MRFFLERERARERDRTLVAAARRIGDVSRAQPSAAAAATEQGPDAEVARAGTRVIRRRDVEERAALALYRLRAELARERLRRLDELVDERLWQSAAERAGTTVAALRAATARDVPAVGDADVDRYFATEVLPRDPRAQKNAARIRPYLEFRARRAAERRVLDAERARTAVEVLIGEPAPPRFALEPGPGGWRGDAAAPHRVLLLTSYRGAASRRTWEAARALVARPDVRLGVRPLLPQWDPDATAVAAAVRCAGSEGGAWSLHDDLATTAPLPDEAAIARAARARGLDADALLACMARPETLAAVAADSAAAERLGIVEPPVVLVDGVVLGAPSPERLAAALAAPAPAEAPALPAPRGSVAQGAPPAVATPAAPLSAPSRTASASP